MGVTDLPEIALSVRQPWAWAIIFAGKDIENRGWVPSNPGLKYRGRVAIHASKGMTKEEYLNGALFMRRAGVDCPSPANLARGAIIGSVEVVDAVQMHKSPWFFGPWGLVLREPKPCEPIPVNGQLGFFKWRA